MAITTSVDAARLSRGPALPMSAVSTSTSATPGLYVTSSARTASSLALFLPANAHLIFPCAASQVRGTRCMVQVQVQSASAHYVCSVHSTCQAECGAALSGTTGAQLNGGGIYAGQGKVIEAIGMTRTDVVFARREYMWCSTSGSRTVQRLRRSSIWRHQELG
jgi:hypothetical protein